MKTVCTTHFFSLNLRLLATPNKGLCRSLDGTIEQYVVERLHYV